jgi:protein Mpv17
LLERRVKSTSKVVVGLKRTALDQIFAAPMLTSTFIFILQLLNGHSMEMAASRTRSVFVPVMWNNYKIWPAVQFLNMSVIPLQYRVVFVQFIAVFWNMYLSSKLHR